MILHFSILVLGINDQLGIHDLKRHHEEGQATRDLPPRGVICVDELALLVLKGVVDFPGGIILQDEEEGSTKLSEADLVSIDKAEVYGLVWFNGINLHVGGLDE